MERVAPDAFDLLGSRHPPSLLDRPDILVSGQGPARAQPPTEAGSLDAIAEEPEDTTGAADDGGSVADAPAAPGPHAAAAASPPAVGGGLGAPSLATVEAGDNDDDSAAPPPAPAIPAPQGDPETALPPQDDPPPAPAPATPYGHAGPRRRSAMTFLEVTRWYRVAT